MADMEASARRNLTRTEIKRLQRDIRRRTERPLALLLDSVQTPQNVGAIIRTAAALSVDRLLLAGSTASPGHPKSQRISLRTEHLVPWSEHPVVGDAFEVARAEGYLTVGIELASGAVPLPELDLPSDTPVCLVVGHEQHGLSKPALAESDQLAYIPAAGKAGPLNVAASAAIALYELRRGEWAGAVPVD